MCSVCVQCECAVHCLLVLIILPSIPPAALLPQNASAPPPQSPQLLARLRGVAEVAKVKLSSEEQVVISMPVGGGIQAVLTRQVGAGSAVCMWVGESAVKAGGADRCLVAAAATRNCVCCLLGSRAKCFSCALLHCTELLCRCLRA